MKKIFISLSITALTFLIQNCGPKEDTRPIYFIDQNTIDFCVFDAGSWWVYEEESTGVRDTIKVRESIRQTSDYEKIHFRLNGFFSKYEPNKYLVSDSWAGGSSKPEVSVFQFSFVYPPFMYNELLFVSTLDTNYLHVLSDINKIKLIDTLSSIEVNKKVYNDIRVFKNFSGDYNFYAKKIHWARHVGLIKITRADGTTWNLIDYKVSQENL